MTTYKIAHVHEQGQDLIIVPLADRFEHSTTADEKAAFAAEIERRAHVAGLRGHVVLIWPAGHNTKFLAPRRWHPFVESLSLSAVCANINRELRCA